MNSLHKMTYHFVFVLFMIHVTGDEIRIETLDSGETDSFEKPNVFDDYTSLSDYRVFPSEKQFFRFEIEACHDAFILLSASIDLKSQDFYEICIGGSSNQITSLRRKYNDFNQLMISTPNILGCTEKSTFEIRWTLDGTIYLVKESAVGTETIIDWTDSIPLLIQGVGIMTGWGSDGIWIIESSTFTFAVGQYCGVPSTYGNMNILSTSVQRSRIICLFKCSSNSACLGVNFNVKTKECELLSGGQVIDKSIRSDWSFYTKC